MNRIEELRSKVDPEEVVYANFDGVPTAELWIDISGTIWMLQKGTYDLFWDQCYELARAELERRGEDISGLYFG